MAHDKVFRMYPTFDGWVQAHKHSSSSISYALEDALENETGGPIEALRSYIEGLDDLSSEIRAEITEARFWVRYFKKQKGDSRE
jgi:hypothetical protein